MILGDFIHEYKIDNYNEINLPVIMYLYELQKQQPANDMISNRRGWQKNHLENKAQMQTLSQAIFSKFHDFVVQDLQPLHEVSVYLNNLFANINAPGSYHVPHIHDSHWTGVYYLQAPEDCGDLCILKPHQGPHQAQLAKLFASCRLEQNIKPRPGYGYFFPSHLVHYVEENKNPQQTRISLSYNITVKAKNEIPNDFSLNNSDICAPEDRGL